MNNAAYLQRRGQLEQYFDRTAVRAWERLTSDAPVSRIRASVRAGRDRMRRAMLDLLPMNLHGRRILDAGCGTGALAQELAGRGADVLAIDLSPTLVELARQRSSAAGASSVEFRSGDMSDPTLGKFDHVVAMDSLIHYEADDIVRMLATLSQRTRHSLLFTFAPRTPALALMHAVGRVFPRSDRAPAIAPVAETGLRSRLAQDTKLRDWQVARGERIAGGFYTSQVMELVRQ
ncbi:MAG TPA: magnesium protoporphyrin IX methyltransferase [Steroidobacteraceae bacterium]